MKERRRSESPPAYQVYETKDGRLVNRTLRVEWPKHPSGNKKLFDGYIRKESSESESEECFSSQGEESSKKNPAYDTSKFIGPATLQDVNEKLLSSDFIIFYQLPDIKDADDGLLPAKLPLLLAYRSSQGKNYYLPIKREKNKWCIKFPNGNQTAKFSTMQNLIEHYYTYGFINHAAGSVDIFRLNLLENASD